MMRALTLHRPWADCAGYPGYRVSADGDVASFRRYADGRLLRPFLTGAYLRVALMIGIERRKELVHVLVLQGFVGPRPDGMEVRHLNGVAADNRLENLAWGTWSQNYDDRLGHGTHFRGEQNVQHKLSTEDVLAIRASSETCVALGARFGVHPTTVDKIRNRKKWAWL